jgi:hypothetical protein
MSHSCQRWLDVPGLRRLRLPEGLFLSLERTYQQAGRQALQSCGVRPPAEAVCASAARRDRAAAGAAGGGGAGARGGLAPPAARPGRHARADQVPAVFPASGHLLPRHMRACLPFRVWCAMSGHCAGPPCSDRLPLGSGNSLYPSGCAGRRESSLQLAQVSPPLAALSATAVPMPGQPRAPPAAAAQTADSVTDEAVTVAGVDLVITILKTKTRPKKLALLGSDGRRYTYLLKVGAVHKALPISKVGGGRPLKVTASGRCPTCRSKKEWCTF